MTKFKTGDWVQAARRLTDDEDEDLLLAELGAIGHVLEVHDPEWPNVYWERTGTVSAHHVSELVLLGDAEVGRRQS